MTINDRASDQNKKNGSAGKETPPPPGADSFDLFATHLFYKGMEQQREELGLTPLTDEEKEAMTAIDLDPNDLADVVYFQKHQSSLVPHDHSVTIKGQAPTARAFGLSEEWHAPSTPFKAPKIHLNPQQKLAARVSLMDAIDRVSAEYAGVAGVSPDFLARTLGGIAVVESSFGALRSVSGTKYTSSAGGAFHFLTGTAIEKAKQYAYRPEIAAELRRMGIDPRGKITNDQAWAIKENDVLAARFVALETIEDLNKNPHLKNNVEAAAAHVYMGHNIGRGGRNTLLTKGAHALDDKITANNPLFFRGTTNSHDVVGRYQTHMAKAIDAAETLRKQVYARSSNAPKTVLASLPEPTLSLN